MYKKKKKMMGKNYSRKSLSGPVFDLEEIEEGLEGFEELEKSSLMSQKNFEKRFGQSPVFITSTLMENGGIPKGTSSTSLIKEAIHVVSCEYRHQQMDGNRRKDENRELMAERIRLHTANSEPSYGGTSTDPNAADAMENEEGEQAPAAGDDLDNSETCVSFPDNSAQSEQSSQEPTAGDDLDNYENSLSCADNSGQSEKSSDSEDIPDNIEENDTFYLELQEVNIISKAAYKELMTLAVEAKTWVVATPALGSLEEFLQMFRSPPLPGKRVEHSIQSASVPIDPELLVFTMMDVSAGLSQNTGLMEDSLLNTEDVTQDRWASSFSHIVSHESVHDPPDVLLKLTKYEEAIKSILLVDAEFQLPTPLVQSRKFCLFRCLRKILPDVWAIVDISRDYFPGAVVSGLENIFRKRPSGLLVRGNGNYSQVIWIENVEIPEVQSKDGIYLGLINSNLAFSAKRWVDALIWKIKRNLSRFSKVKMKVNQRAAPHLLNLTATMRKVYLDIVSETPDEEKWVTLSNKDVRILRNSTDHTDSGVKNYIAVTSFRLQTKPISLTDFLDLEYLLQETSMDGFCFFVTSTPISKIDVDNALLVGSSGLVPVQPSGFAIMPDGFHSNASLVTVAIQQQLNVPDTDQAILIMCDLVNAIVKEIFEEATELSITCGGPISIYDAAILYSNTENVSESACVVIALLRFLYIPSCFLYPHDSKVETRPFSAAYDVNTVVILECRRQLTDIKRRKAENRELMAEHTNSELPYGGASADPDVAPVIENEEAEQAPAAGDDLDNIQNRNNDYLELQEANNISKAAYKELTTIAVEAKTWVVATPALGSLEEYVQMFRSPPLPGKRVYCSTHSAVVRIKPDHLVSIMMDADKWAASLSHIVSRKSVPIPPNVLLKLRKFDRTIKSMLLVDTEFQLPTPLFQPTKFCFWRCLREIVRDVWAILDISRDYFPGAFVSGSENICRKRPSGLFVRGNGFNGDCSEVIWIENVEIPEAIYSGLIDSNLAFSAKRWVDALTWKLKRHESRISIAKMEVNETAAFCLLHITEMMRRVYWDIVSETPADKKWVTLSYKGVRILRNSTDHPDSGVKNYIAVTSFRLQAKPISVIDFLDVEYLLQETSRDGFCFFVTSTPISKAHTDVLLLIGEGTVSVRPSGFALMPDGFNSDASLVTVAIQQQLNVPDPDQEIPIMWDLVNGIIKEISEEGSNPINFFAGYFCIQQLLSSLSTYNVGYGGPISIHDAAILYFHMTNISKWGMSLQIKRHIKLKFVLKTYLGKRRLFLYIPGYFLYPA
ncbi:hypothetical protein RHGRI_002812 [Rhododendron griersonianum]|uniref:START domain-containing protein n=1 Tax=Rhododendron griersonianum TaxID=479676 RepID=A0AAV6LQC9_9ERIC|nr:hypothetical protein RHGRI_002812 [Rhododendron griersonianum]